jgi:uncharacterized protein
LSWLLDANALIALGWPAHQHHDAVHSWFAHHAAEGWFTTATTQSAFLRIVSQPSFSPNPVTVTMAAAALQQTVDHPHHRLLALDFGFEAVLDHCTGGLFGHRQVADAWLLTAAARRGACLVSFDTGLPHLLATAAERQRSIRLLP